MYVQYVSNYDQKVTTTLEALKSDKSFNGLCLDVEKKPMCRGLKLMSFLIMPV